MSDFVGDGGSQMPLTEGETTILLRLAENATAQTHLAGDQALLMQRVVNLLEKLEDRLDQQERAREGDKMEIKAHVTTAMKSWRSQVWLALVLITVLVGVIEVVDISVERWLHAIPH